MLKLILATLVTITVTLAISTVGHANPTYIAGNGGMIIKSDAKPQICDDHSKTCAATFAGH